VGATPDYEDGFDKIALFEKDGEWCHVAIQVSDSKWKSKLGGLEDVHHPLAPMDGGFYGKVVRYLKRPTKS
jgi:hypothetical protein